jgi:hypothetical protein
MLPRSTVAGKFAKSTIMVDIFLGDLSPTILNEMHDDEDMVEAMFLFQVTRFIRLCNQHHVNLIWFTPSSVVSSETQSKPEPSRHNLFLHRMLVAAVRVLNDHSVSWIDLGNMTRQYHKLSRSSSLTSQASMLGEEDPHLRRGELQYPSLTYMQLHMALSYICGCGHRHESNHDGRAELKCY